MFYVSLTARDENQGANLNLNCNIGPLQLVYVISSTMANTYFRCLLVSMTVGYKEAK